MTRKLNTKNLSKLIERTVIFVAILAIIYFIFLWTREDFVMKSYSSGIDGGGLESCAIWNNYLEGYRKAQIYSGIFGFVVPVLFFISKKIINYIYPVVQPRG
jgi:hypothetical protein